MSDNVGAMAPLTPQSDERTRLTSPMDGRPSRPKMIQPHSRLLLEAQRDSAAYHLGRHLDLRRDIWRDIVKGVTKPNDNTFAGDLNALAASIWEFTANKSQLQSDMTILHEVLRNSLQKGKKRLAWTTFGSFVMALLISAERALFEEYYPILKVILWSSLGVFGALDIYYGLGVGLLAWKKSTVRTLQSRTVDDQLRERDRELLSGWNWLALQFTSFI